jgi:hypothetical protein
VTAFLCTESEILDAAALAAYIAPVRAALVAAGGRPAVISSIGGQVVGLVGERLPTWSSRNGRASPRRRPG